MAASVYYRLNKPKENGVLKITPVAILITYYNEGVEVELSTKQKVIPANFTGSRVTKETPRAQKINKALSDLENKLLNFDNAGLSKEEEEAEVRLIITGKQIKKPEIAVIQPEDPTQKKTSLFTVGRFIAQCKRELDIKTVNRYRVFWRVLGRFQKGKRLDMSTADMGFHDRFKNFLYDTPNPNYTSCHLEYNSTIGVYVVTPGSSGGERVGLLDETVFKYLVQFKTFCDWSLARGYKVNLSYKTWPIIKREYPPITINKQELEAIEGLPSLGKFLIKKEREKKLIRSYSIDLDLVRDIFIMECRSGQRISDILRFQANQVVSDIWSLVQKKGNRTKVKNIEIPLDGFCANIKVILEKYSYVLPKISEADLNIGIREITRRAGITEPFFIERWAGNKKIIIPGLKYEFFSSHTGKKSFITILAGEGVPLKAISDLTGTSIRTIERHYLGKTDVKKLREYLKLAEGKSLMRVAN